MTFPRDHSQYRDWMKYIYLPWSRFWVGGKSFVLPCTCIGWHRLSMCSFPSPLSGLNCGIRLKHECERMSLILHVCTPTPLWAPWRKNAILVIFVFSVHFFISREITFDACLKSSVKKEGLDQQWQSSSTLLVSSIDW